MNIFTVSCDTTIIDIRAPFLQVDYSCGECTHGLLEPNLRAPFIPRDVPCLGNTYGLVETPFMAIYMSVDNFEVANTSGKLREINLKETHFRTDSSSKERIPGPMAISFMERTMPMDPHGKAC